MVLNEPSVPGTAPKIGMLVLLVGEQSAALCT